MGNARNPTWTFSEIEMLKEKMELFSVAELLPLFDGRSEKAIRRKIEKLRDAGEVGYRTQRRKKAPKKDDDWGDKGWSDDWS